VAGRPLPGGGATGPSHRTAIADASVLTWRTTRRGAGEVPRSPARPVGRLGHVPKRRPARFHISTHSPTQGGEEPPTTREDRHPKRRSAQGVICNNFATIHPQLSLRDGADDGNPETGE